MTEQMRSTAAASARAVLGMGFGLLLIAILVVGGSALAQHRALNRADRPAQMGRQSASSGQTDAEHASLAKLAGEYNRVIKFLGQTGAAAAPSTGTSKFSVVLGGRFILEESHDTVFGRPVDGLRIYGYNDATKQYEMARMYTMSNAITLMKGTSDDGGKTIDFSGEAGSSGAGTMRLHALLRQINEDQFRVTMATVGADGKESPFQETDYTRKK